MADEICPGLFRIEVPLPRNPLRSINSYVIKGDRNLLIDTGMNMQECISALQIGLDELHIDVNRTDILITHMHSDHSGLVGRFLSNGCTAYVGRMDAGVMRMGPDWDLLDDFAALNGFPIARFGPTMRSHPGSRYGDYGRVEYTILPEGGVISVGEYSFRCIETPGHTLGHICLYEPHLKILISGDHVLGDITPNITSWSGDEDRLGLFLQSLDKVYDLDVELVLPGHRRVFKEFRRRIDELKEHHRVRADEVLSILDGTAMNAYQVAARMTWDITYDSFDRLPVAQQWFASGEALAHLQFLKAKGLVHDRMNDGAIVFSV